jgi:hypothetical protein
MAKIPDKQTFKRLSSALRLGNHFQAWDSLAELEASGYNGFVTQQALLPGLSSTDLFIPNIAVSEVLERSRGLSGVYWREIAHRPDCPGGDCHGCGRTINLEAMYGDRGLCVRHSHHPTLNLRHDLIVNGREVWGLEALIVLRRYLQEDHEVLQEIWESYPDAVIEASRFSSPVGVLNNRLVVWEVRDY